MLHHCDINLKVTGQSKKKCRNPSCGAASLSTILQEVQLGDTVSSKAFNLLFNIRPLFLIRYRKFCMSLCSQLEFHKPKHFFRGAGGGRFVFIRLEKVVTVLKLCGSAEIFELSSNTSRNFFDPFLILLTKFSTVSQRLSVSSFFSQSIPGGQES